MIIPKHRYDEVFEIEVEGWCYAITRFPGEISAGLVHRLIKEFAPSLVRAMEYHYAFDPLAVARKLSKATKYLVPEKEITFCLLTHLPRPELVDEEAQYTLAMVIDQAEKVYAGVLQRLERKWKGEREEARRKAAEKVSGKLPPSPAKAPSGQIFTPPSAAKGGTRPWVVQGY